MRNMRESRSSCSDIMIYNFCMHACTLYELVAGFAGVACYTSSVEAGSNRPSRGHHSRNFYENPFVHVLMPDVSLNVAVFTSSVLLTSCLRVSYTHCYVYQLH